MLKISPFADSAEHTVDTIALDVAGASGEELKWSGGVLAPNGLIYGIPLTMSSVLVLDPVVPTVTGLPISLFAAGDSDKMWWGGVLAPNGKIYGIPYGSRNVLSIDHGTGTVDATTLAVPDVPEVPEKWFGGVLAPNGKIYGIPHSASSVLVLDPDAEASPVQLSAGAMSQADVTAMGGRLWATGVLSTNGLIYAFPHNAPSALVIDPASDIVLMGDGTSGLNVLDPGAGKWQGGLLAPDGMIYAVPKNANRILLIKPWPSSAPPFEVSGCAPSPVCSLGPGGGDIPGYVVDSDGAQEFANSLAVPREAELPDVGMPDYAMIRADIDVTCAENFRGQPEAVCPPPSGEDAADFASSQIPGGSGKWTDLVLAADGNLYGIPYEADQVLRFEPATSERSFFGDTFSGNKKWQRGVLAPDGRIYGM